MKMRKRKTFIEMFGIVDLFKDVVDNKVVWYCEKGQEYCACGLTSTIESGHSGSNWQKIANKVL